MGIASGPPTPVTACVAILLVCGTGVADAYEARQACAYTFREPPSTFQWPPEGMRATVFVSAPAGCPWTAVSNSPFITIVAGTSNSGDGFVTFDIAPNPGSSRDGSLTIAGQRYPVSQRGCLFILLGGNSVFIPAEGGVRTLKISSFTSGCSWNAASHVSWISSTPGGAGVGPGYVTYGVEPNVSGAPRQGTLSVGYLTLTMTQSAGRSSDFNHDSYPDLLWQHQTSGQIAAWLMRGLSLVDGQLLSPSQVGDSWTIVGSADFNLDGHPDIVWQRGAQVAVWLMNGTTMMAGGVVAEDLFGNVPFTVRAVGDFDGDGRPDLVIQRGNGEIEAWVIYSLGIFRTPFTPSHVSDRDWVIVGAGDFNRDGQTDLLWQNQTNGLISVWTIDGFRQTRGMLLNPGQVADTNWKIRGVMDIDRDGQPDLIWQNQANGLISTWLMDGLHLREGTLFSPGQVSDTNWVLVGPR